MVELPSPENGCHMSLPLCLSIAIRSTSRIPHLTCKNLAIQFKWICRLRDDTKTLIGGWFVGALLCKLQDQKMLIQQFYMRSKSGPRNRHIGIAAQQVEQREESPASCSHHQNRCYVMARLRTALRCDLTTIGELHTFLSIAKCDNVDATQARSNVVDRLPNVSLNHVPFRR